MIAEPPGGSHTAPEHAARLVGAAIVATLADLRYLPPGQLVTERHERFRRFGA